MLNDWKIVSEASARWQARSKERNETIKKLREGGPASVETPERISKRLERLTNAITEERAARAALSASEPGATAPASASFLVDRVGFERVMGKADFLNMNFLELALAVSRFVGRIHIRTSPTSSSGYGTGSMVSPRLLLTNNHVIGSRFEANYSEVEFDYQYDRFGRLLPVVAYRLDPRKFFITNPELDYTLVAVQERSVDNKVELKQYGWSRLIAEQGKVLLGDPLNIIQHPKGEAKQIVLRSNQLVDLFDTFAHYMTDTEPGSSGSPVYNDQWEVIALHHAGVPKKVNGNYIAKDGSIWIEGMDPDKLDWVANEGIRVSSIVKDIERQSLTSEQGKLRDELLTLNPPHPFEAAAMAEASARQETGGSAVINKPSPLTQGGFATGAISEDGSITWTIPLQVSVRLGTPAAGGAVQPSQPAGAQPVARRDEPPPTIGQEPPDEVDPEMKQALKELEAARTRDYYKQAEDERARDDYYRDVDTDLDPEDFYRQLSELLKQTHRDQLRYKPSTHLYPWVDLREAQPRPVIKSIYSGREVDPREFIEEDFRIDRKREQLKEMLMKESSFSAVSVQEQLVLLEATLPYNCEHVVPQSWFGKREPMRGDLHHLFACESGCNSFRGNTPYFDFTDFEEVIRESCGKREENKFEPSFGKGPVARATLYFLLRYPGEINETSKEYTEDRIKTLLDWHSQDQVTKYEKHRNAAIFEKQGNRNPLIDFPEWAEKIDFMLGLG